MCNKLKCKKNFESIICLTNLLITKWIDPIICPALHISNCSEAQYVHVQEHLNQKDSNLKLYSDRKTFVSCLFFERLRKWFLSALSTSRTRSHEVSRVNVSPVSDLNNLKLIYLLNCLRILRKRASISTEIQLS